MYENATPDSELLVGVSLLAGVSLLTGVTLVSGVLVGTGVDSAEEGVAIGVLDCGVTTIGGVTADGGFDVASVTLLLTAETMLESLGIAGVGLDVAIGVGVSVVVGVRAGVDSGVTGTMTEISVVATPRPISC